MFLPGGCSEGETEGPKQSGGSEDACKLESELWGHLRTPQRTVLGHGKRPTLVDREAVSGSPWSPCQHPSWSVGGLGT